MTSVYRLQTIFSSALAWCSALTTWAAQNQPLLTATATLVAILASLWGWLAARKCSRLRDEEIKTEKLRQRILTLNLQNAETPHDAIPDVESPRRPLDAPEKTFDI